MVFDELRLALTSAPLLCMPCFEKLFTVHIDASDIAVGAVLTQQHDGLDMPVCYYSKRLSDTESRWSIYEGELYVIIQALGKWRCYLINHDTVVYTDYQALKYFMSQSKLYAKQQHWLDFLAEFSLGVQYKPGAQNILPDALSRFPEQPQDGSSSGSACVQSMILEHSWLKKVYDGQQRYEKLAPYLVQAASNDSEFIMCTVYSFSLLYQRPKKNVY